MSWDMNADAPSNARGSLLRRIHETYASLPDRETRVADTILNAPSEMPVWTASELAGLAGVSKATVSRFVQRLGYRSFEDARQDARTLRETGSPLFMKGDMQMASSHADLLRAEAGVIEATLAQIDPRVLVEIAGALAEARQVRLIGFRNSRFLADYLTAQLAQLRADVAPLALEGQTLAEGIAGVGPGDVVVVIGLRRRPARFGHLVRLLAGRGARLVLVADKGLREAPAFATWTLTCAVETALPLDSYVGVMTVLRLLAADTAEALGDAALHHLNEVETLRDALSELEQAR
jgi:DNA-binding MurR/RpiR family transcriptional regulator